MKKHIGQLCSRYKNGLILILMLWYLPSNAQFSVGVSLGPGWGIIGSEFKTRTCQMLYYSNAVTRETTYADTSFSCGGGLHAVLTGVYTFTKYPWLSVQLGAGYAGGQKLTVKGGYLQDVAGNSAYFVHYNTTYRLRGRTAWLEPALRFSYPGKRWSPYLSIGPQISYHFIDETADLQCAVSLSSYRPYQRINTQLQYRRGLSVGLALAGGIDLNAGAGFHVFLECAAAYDNYTPKSAKMVKYNLDGGTRLPQMTTSAKEFEFTDNANASFYNKDGEFVSLLLVEPDYAGNPQQEPDKPSELRSYSFSFSNVAINIGLRITISRYE
ncbi:MAG: hypothetical protein WCM76_07830 [Bacteroidota bacterium]